MDAYRSINKVIARIQRFVHDQRRALFGAAVCCLVIVGCRDGGTEESPVARSSAQALITKTVEQRLRLARRTRVEGLLTAGFPDSLAFESEPSGVVPNLIYYTGGFTPAGAYDGELVVRAAQLGSRSVVLNGPADWSALVATGRWRVRSGTDAQAVCEEVVTKVLAPRRAAMTTIIYRDSTTLRPGVETVVEPDRTLIAELARPPVAQQDAEGAWQVDLWAIESDGTMNYRCHVANTAPGVALRVISLDSLPCSGQLASCGVLLETLRGMYGRRDTTKPTK
jgi:hypothetical protein